MEPLHLAVCGDLPEERKPLPALLAQVSIPIARARFRKWRGAAGSVPPR